MVAHTTGHRCTTPDVFAKGPSIKDVHSKLVLFDPLPSPSCPSYDVTVTTYTGVFTLSTLG